jgi:hypothetical protein
VVCWCTLTHYTSTWMMLFLCYLFYLFSSSTNGLYHSVCHKYHMPYTMLWSNFHLERLPFLQSVNKFLTYFYTREITNQSTAAPHLPLSWVRSKQPTLPSYLLKAHFNIISPSTPWFYKCSLSLLSPSGLQCTSPLPHTCDTPPHTTFVLVCPPE